MIGDVVAALQFELERGESLPGTEDEFESALRPATIARLSLHQPVRAALVLPYAVEVRIEQPGGGSSAGAPSPVGAQTASDRSNVDAHTAAAQAYVDAQAAGHATRPQELAVVVRNDPDSPVAFLRVAISGVTPARLLPTIDDDLALEFDPGEYFVELRRGGSWAEVEHPVPLNRVSYFGERQAAAL
ncbi:hypothetical protein [Subtercola sp. YIM 133946]|uniref:hypothetical protein n=1 Tax=Subtercola sp. YIM 133946 TaxID=3118909 RepID=UPI002F93B9CA